MSFPDRLFVVLCAISINVQAQPGISKNGVVNSASRIPPSLPGGALAPGARFTVLGVRLGSPESTKVAISHGETRLPVAATKIGTGRIDGIVPASAPIGLASLTVTVDNKVSKPFSVKIASSNPGIYSRNNDGWGPGVIDNVGAQGKPSPNSYANPAKLGQTITITVTGMGNATQMDAMIGNRPVKATRIRSSSKAGEERVNIRIPADAPLGCYVPLYLMPTATQASNVVTVSIGPRTGPCNPGPIPRVAGKKIALMTLFRTSFKMQRKDAESVRDDAKIMFGAIDHQIIEPPLMLVPPPGTCTAYTSLYTDQGLGLVNSIAFSLITQQGTGLDAGGSLILSRDGQQRTIGRLIDGVYRGGLGTGGASAKRGAPALFLEPGELFLKGAGGADVGPLTLKLESPVAFQWTDREQTRVVNRSRGATVHWQGAAADRLIMVVATNVDQITAATGSCICTARATAKELKLPPALLAHVPVTQDIPGIPFDQLYVTSIPANAAVHANIDGLSAVSVVSTYAIGRVVEYR